MFSIKLTDLPKWFKFLEMIDDKNLLFGKHYHSCEECIYFDGFLGCNENSVSINCNCPLSIGIRHKVPQSIEKRHGMHYFSLQKLQQMKFPTYEIEAKICGLSDNTKIGLHTFFK